MAKGDQASWTNTVRNIQACARRMDKTFPSGIRVIAEEIKTDILASRPGAGVPRDEGALAGTVGVEGGGRGTMASLEIYAGGPAAPYALIQHENLDYKHPVGENRYIVRAVERWRPDGSSAINALRDNLAAAARAIR